VIIVVKDIILIFDLFAGWLRALFGIIGKDPEMKIIPISLANKLAPSFIIRKEIPSWIYLQTFQSYYDFLGRSRPYNPL
jgi:hypothetical protein